jgi:hypothetical protein
MRRAISIVALAAASLAIAAQAPAVGKPPKPGKPGKPGMSSATITASPATVLFGSPTTLAGQLSGTKASGAAVTLQAEPFGTKTFTKVATVTANSAGHYSFSVTPNLNTMYRVMARTAPAATSASVLVDVQVRVTLGVSTHTPKSGSKVTFAGFVTPAYNGSVVLVQRKTKTGWHKIASATLFAATLSRSHYSKGVRITKSGKYRVRFVPPPGRLANNSPVRKLIVSP